MLYNQHAEYDMNEVRRVEFVQLESTLLWVAILYIPYIVHYYTTHHIAYQDGAQRECSRDISDQIQSFR